MWKKIANAIIVIALVVGTIISICQGVDAGSYTFKTGLMVFAWNMLLVLFAVGILGMLVEISENIQIVADSFRMKKAEEEEINFMGKEPVGKDMWACKKCGALNASGSMYCSSCGADKNDGEKQV